MGIANAQTEDSTLVFKRPYLYTGDFFEARIDVNGVRACTMDSEHGTKIVTCEHKVKAGEIAIKTSTSREGSYEYIIDVEKGKTYTLAVYKMNLQAWDLVFSTISETLIKNKAKPQPEYSQATFKVQVISIK